MSGIHSRHCESDGPEHLIQDQSQAVHIPFRLLSVIDLILNEIFYQVLGLERITLVLNKKTIDQKQEK